MMSSAMNWHLHVCLVEDCLSFPPLYSNHKQIGFVQEKVKRLEVMFAYGTVAAREQMRNGDACTSRHVKQMWISTLVVSLREAAHLYLRTPHTE